MRRALWRASLSHYRRHPGQLLALLLIILLSTALWSGVWDLTRQARDSLQQSSQWLSGLHDIQRDDGAPLRVDDFVRLRRAGVCVAPWLVVADDGGDQRIGIDGLAMGCFPRSLTGGDALSGEGPFIDIGEAVRQTEAAGRDAALRLLTPNGDAALPPGYRLAPAEQRLQTGELADSFLFNLDALCVLVLLITGLLVRSVYLLGLSQRRSSFLLLQRYGVPERTLQRQRLLELGLIAVVGALPGTLLGLMLASGFASGFGRIMAGLFDVSLFAADLSPMRFLPVLVVTGMVMLWGLLGDRQAPGRSHRVGLDVAVLMLLAGLVGLLAGQRLSVIFLALAAVFLGTGLLTPTLLARLADRGAQHTRQPLRQWSLRELAVMLRRLALPVVALQFAAATVIAIQALVTSFESTFQQWLEQRLQGDAFVQLADPSDLAPALVALERNPAVIDGYPVRRGQGELASGPSVDLLALPAGTPQLQRWTFIAADPDPWAALADGAVMVNEQLARREGIGPGDRVAFQLAGERRDASVAAVYADYGRPRGEILLAANALPPAFRPDFLSLTLRLAPDAQVASVRATLAGELPPAAFEVRDNATVRGLAERIFRQTFVLTRAISLLTLLLAGVSLLVLGWVFFGTRRWYFHLLRVWGLGRRALGWRLCGLSLGLTMLATLAALPLGVLLTWALVQRINPAAFGWSLPMAVYPLFWLQILGLAAAIGALVGCLIQRQVGDRPPEPVGVHQVQGADR
ncbi:FtsX-like permease family protein [Marinobacter sp. JSM 1782161]|uniref:FtsX-like permease family protein n=1 Tax=Marinobacter sp. JSM 1782161 TaxID=2685906 RepID=UPI001402E0C3|nr:ABC transporter permease [Marinobacter sp. JSM 1782161]